MRIGIVGTGNMGRALGLRWAEAGHEIRFGARVVKAFNTSSFESLQLTRDEARAQGAQTLLAGDDAAALDLVAGLAQDLGMDPIRCGALADAPHLEAVARVLIGQIIERGDFLLQAAISALEPPAHAARLGTRS
jgi:predicted dinucleotide-binding enzyme